MNSLKFNARQGIFIRINLFVYFICLLLCCAFILNGKVINNKEKPLSKNSGRIVKLKKVLKISDADGDFYLKRPKSIKIAQDGSIFFKDENQFLKFSKNGKFLGNQQKVGEGPGEYNNISNYFIKKDFITLFTHRGKRILKTDLLGNVLEEIKTEIVSPTEYRNFLKFDGNKYYFIKSSYGDIAKLKSGEFSLKHILAWGKINGISKETGLNFIRKKYILKKAAKNGFMLRIMDKYRITYTVFGDYNLLVSNSLKYLIYNVDIIRGKIINKFKRDYKPVVYKEEKKKKGMKMKGPTPEFFTDVQKILINAKDIWVFTSTVDKTKGVLIDVFSIDGKYQDNFYLQLPQIDKANDLKNKTITIHNNHLYTFESDDDENPILVKYKILNKSEIL